MRYKVSLAMVMLLVVSLACSFGGTGDDAGVTPTEDVSSQGDTGGGDTGGDTGGDVGGDTGGDTGDALAISPEGLEGLDSYRSQMTMRFTGQSGTVEEMTINQEETRNPSAQHYSMVVGGEAIEYVRIADTLWVSYGTGWMQSQQGPEEIEGFGEGMLWDLNSFSDSLSDYEYTYEGREQVNGIDTKHYTLELTAEQAAFLIGSQTNEFEGEVWISDESGLPAIAVKYEMRWAGTFWMGDEEGETELIYEMFDINESFTIEPPEAASTTGLPEDIPTYPNTSDFFSIESMVSFTAPDDWSVVSDFYRQEMTAQGWSLSSDNTFGTTSMQTWNKDGRQVDLIITGDGSSSSVVLNLSE